MIISRVLADGARNHTIQFSGIMEKNVFDPKELMKWDRPYPPKIGSVLWLIQEKMGIHLWWDKETPLFPMESRNSMRFDTALQPPDGWKGVFYYDTFGVVDSPKHFMFILDIDK